MRPYFLVLFSLWAGSAQAQRLMWETTYNVVSSAGWAFLTYSLTPARQLLVTGGGGNTGGPGRAPFQALYCSYGLNGTLLHSQLGRGIITGDQALCAGAAGRYWWVGNAARFGVTNNPPYAFVQRLTARGDTLAGGPALAPVPQEHYSMAALAAGRQIVVAGMQGGTTNGQSSRYTLLAFDTATWAVRWRYIYSRPVFANDHPIGIVRTPRGGYLLTGDGQVLNSSRQHLLLETDSLGRQLKQRLIYPLGANFAAPNANGARTDADVITNIIALPNAQGYLTTGVADSLSNGGTIHHQRAYLMRLDTALNVTWVYRNPPNLFGNGTTSQRVNKVRLLNDGTAAYLVRDVRGAGTPDLYIVRVDLVTGQRRSITLLQSNTQRVLTPYDWDLLGDGTLVVCGRSEQVGVSVVQGWLARFDMRGTPLGTALPQASSASSKLTLRASPNPATEVVTITADGAMPTDVTFELVSVSTGRVVSHQPAIPADARLTVPVAGLAPGVYAGRLLHGIQLLGTCKIVILH